MAEERDIISSLQFPLALTLQCPSFPRELTLSALGEGVLLEFSWAGASLLAGNTLQLGSGEDLSGLTVWVGYAQQQNKDWQS